ncbi:MAG TPA: hypothetical protein VHC91_13610 [Trinickia sp.]|uniref:hypothetical protein n=1 Tax=Trinickia sp. TaxID=2571163 RepID=UPI002BAC5F21|nr:hypothetical protein [Trinickia sp.]HVW51413.1 hypothetical protein [Trinickia sp.]
MKDLQERATALAELAHSKLIRRLQDAGNDLSSGHREATRLMLVGMARQALGVEPGRFAYGLPCGGGKTQGVAALILAAADIEPRLTFAVATSQVEALCELKRQLTEAGMSADDIGLWHSLRVDKQLAGAGTGYASEPTTDEHASPRVLLLSQEKVRRLRERMVPRSLLVWDESLVATEAQSLAVSRLNTANAIASTLAPKMTPHLAKVVVTIGGELAALRADSQRTPKVLKDVLTADEMQAVRDSLATVNRRDLFGKALAATVDALLRLLAMPVSVVANGSGQNADGVIRYEVTVDPALANIAILDASHTIRLLVQADQTITNVKLPDYKRYSGVSVRQIDMATGKQQMTRSEAATRPVARQVAQVIESLPEDDAILLFTFKDALDYLRRNLAAEGVKLHRIEFATWGQETSRNEWVHCQHVIMAGVLRRNPLELSASLLAQQGDMTRRNSAKALRDVTLSEMAHCALQAMNRGACRLTDAGGEAHAMTCTILVAKADQLRGILSESLPGVVWPVAEKPRRAPTKADNAAEQIKVHLAGLTHAKVSLASIRKALPQLSALNPRTVSAAVDIALIGSTWSREDRSLVRLRRAFFN